MTTRIASFNVNGIRACQKRGFEGWLSRRQPDVVALQEVRCPVNLLPEGVFGDHHLTYDPGDRAGRNGVALLTREAPVAVRTFGAPVLRRAPGEDHVELTEPDDSPTLPRELKEFAGEGRYVEVDLADAPLTVASLYLPKGGLPADLQEKMAGRMREEPDGGAKFERKMRFLAGFAKQIDRSRKAAKAAGREFLVMGDFNVAHSEQDIKNWRGNKNSEGFLPPEREWFSSILSPRTLVDVVRSQHPDTDGPYAWWSWMGQAFERDTGWRIDYHLATPGLARAAVSSSVDKEPSRAERLSDHAPVVVEYDL
ncbi:exodeoxyribonuclease III [Kytococcus sp. Marseille-QA3725]